MTQIVLDEADEMLNMGFYKDVRGIIDLLKSRESLSMFSATISREVLDIGWLYQHNAEEITVQPREESQPKITQYMLETSGRNKLSDLAQIIIGEGYKRVMVFCDTKFNTATLANQLARLGFSVDCLHGDLSQKERNQIMQAFRDGKLAILVATDVAARGIDVSDVDAVINYDVPSENEHYTHRIGRTGRAKKEGVSYLFYVPEEKKRVQELLRLTRNTDLCTPVHFDFNHEHIVVEKSRTTPTVSRSSAIFKGRSCCTTLCDGSFLQKGLTFPFVEGVEYSRKEGVVTHEDQRSRSRRRRDQKEHPLLRGGGAHYPQPRAGQRLPQLLAGGCGAPAPHQAAA